MMEKRLRYIDFEKGICALIVVYIHITHIYMRNTELNFLHRLCIPQFALLAGYNLCHKENVNTIKTILFTLSKMIYIYFISIIVTQLIFQKNIDLDSAIIIVITGGVVPFYNIPIWYVPHYMSLFIISLLVIKMNNIISQIVEKNFNKKNYISYEFLLIISILLAYIGFVYNGENYFYIKQSLIMVPFTMIGFVINKSESTLKKYLEGIDKNRKRFIYLLSIIIIIVLLVLFIFLTLSDGNVDIWPFFFFFYLKFYITSISGGILLFVVSKILCGISILDIFTKFIGYIGKKSIYICCLSQPVQIVIINHYNDFFKKLNEESIYTILFKIIIIVIVTIIFSYLFEREQK